MEISKKINRKKIYLSIILVLFILSSCLLLTCLHTFASTSDLTIDDFEVFSSEGFNIADYYYHYGQPDPDNVEFFNDFITTYKIVDFVLVQPDGNLYMTNVTSPYNSVRFFFNKNDLPLTYSFDFNDKSNNKVYTSTYTLSNRNYDNYTHHPDRGWINFYTTGLNYPVLIGLEEGYEIDYENSSGITRTFYDSEFGVEVDVTMSSYAPETYGSVVGRVFGYSLPSFGTVEVDLYKENLTSGTSELIEESLYAISTLYGSFSFNFKCPPLEVGSYYFHAKYTIDDEVLFEDTESFELDGTIKDYNSVIVRDDESYYVDTSYFNKVFQIVSPKHFNLYNSDVWFELYTPQVKNGGYTTINFWGHCVYDDSFAIKDSLSSALGQEFNRKVDVYLNNVLIKEYDFKNFGVANGTLPSALLKRGKNTLFVVSSQGLEGESPVYFNWLAPDGTYRYIHSSVEFFYKTKDGSEGLIVEEDPGGSSGARIPTIPGGGSSDMPNDDSSGRGGGSSGNNGYIDFTGLGTPPDRSNYSDDIFGTIGYALDFIIYILSMPFKVLFGALEWLISNFLTLFSWVGQLASIIGSWFNFLPREVRSLLLGGFMCSIIAFVLRLFRK